MKYVAEVISHITVDVQNREQAEFRVNTILSKMQSLFENGEVVFHTNFINRKHYHHMTHCYHSPVYGDLHHQHINVSNLKPGSIFAFWNRVTDALYLYQKGYANTWGVEKWEYNGVISKSQPYDNDTVLKQIDASNDHDPNAIGYVVGMEHVAPKSQIQQLHPSAVLIGYKVRKDDNND